MTEQLTAHIERIRQLSPSLNAATDDAARVVDRVERFLRDECSIGFSVSVEYAAEDGADRLRGSSLIYERIDGKFRLGVRTETYHGGSVDTSSYVMHTWSGAGREVKLASFEKLPALLEKIALRAEKATANAARLAPAAEAILKALGPAAAPEKAETATEEARRGDGPSAPPEPLMTAQQTRAMLDAHLRARQ